MAQKQTGVGSKQTGEDLSASEFNSVNETINDNATDAELRIAKLEQKGDSFYWSDFAKASITPPVIVNTEEPSWQDIITLDTVTAIPNGEYGFTVSVSWQMSDTNDSGAFRILINGVQYKNVYNTEPKDNTDIQLDTLVSVLDQFSGIKEIKVQGRITSSANDMNVLETTVMLECKKLL